MAPRPFIEPSALPTYRVAVVGASTVQGFPHPRRLAAAAFLEAMLQDALPHRQVEVFNLGITSIASFAVAQTLADAFALDKTRRRGGLYGPQRILRHLRFPPRASNSSLQHLTLQFNAVENPSIAGRIGQCLASKRDCLPQSTRKPRRTRTSAPRQPPPPLSLGGSGD